MSAGGLMTLSAPYHVPPFPSLYWPVNTSEGEAKYLLTIADIWRFTFYWTLIMYEAVHLATSLWAVGTHLTAIDNLGNRRGRNKEKGRLKDFKGGVYVWIIPVVYCLVGGLEALMAGSLVGLILGAVYQAGYFKMSTWMPLFWANINVLILILSSYSIQGGL